jgi:LmbE family N-acetylglucosaminyl deacetylase
MAATTCIDVSDYMSQKISAIAAYRTQCPITPDLLPEVIWRDIFAHEYFVRIYPGIEMETDFYDIR